MPQPRSLPSYSDGKHNADVTMFWESHLRHCESLNQVLARPHVGELVDGCSSGTKPHERVRVWLLPFILLQFFPVVYNHLFNRSCREQKYFAVKAYIEEAQPTELSDCGLFGEDLVKLKDLGGIEDKDLGWKARRSQSLGVDPELDQWRGDTF